MPIVQHDMLRSLCFEIFKVTGIPEEDANIISTHLVDSHLSGHDVSRHVAVGRLCAGMKHRCVR